MLHSACVFDKIFSSKPATVSHQLTNCHAPQHSSSSARQTWQTHACYSSRLASPCTRESHAYCSTGLCTLHMPKTQLIIQQAKFTLT